MCTLDYYAGFNERRAGGLQKSSLGQQMKDTDKSFLDQINRFKKNTLLLYSRVKISRTVT